MNKIFEEKPLFFIGIEVEKTRYCGERTLFANGDISIEDLRDLTIPLNVTHCYLGASKTHKDLLENHDLDFILEFLCNMSLHVTIEVEYEDVPRLTNLLERYRRVALNITLPLPTSLLERVSIKVESYNPFVEGDGVYCMCPSKANFTSWKEYEGDETI